MELSKALGLIEIERKRYALLATLSLKNEYEIAHGYQMIVDAIDTIVEALK